MNNVDGDDIWMPDNTNIIESVAMQDIEQAKMRIGECPVTNYWKSEKLDQNAF